MHPERRCNLRKVVMVGPGGEMYGSDRVFLASASALASSDCQVRVVLPRHGPLSTKLQALGIDVEVFAFPVLRKQMLAPRSLPSTVARLLTGSFRTALWLIKARPSAVYVSTLTIGSWAFWGKLLGSRVVLHVHEAETHLPAIIKLLLCAPVFCSDCVIVNSNYTKRFLHDSVGSWATRKTLKVLNAIAVPEGGIVRVGAPTDENLNLLYVGRLSERKGVMDAVEALALLHSWGVQATLTLVGDIFEGNDAFLKDLKYCIGRLGLGEAVSFEGFQAEVWPYYRRSHIALVPSRSAESFGNTAVEAVLAATPLIVTNFSGLTEAVDGYEGVVQVDPSDPRQIAEAVRHILLFWEDFAISAASDREIALRRHSSKVYDSEIRGAISPRAGL
ncbi:glycosyltransferase [Arthrobacter cheniae]|uniref:Glycosyltransferase n=1 Tax=Arthrobacter cheniae TaxID=1258888 RepID=A0A3A5M386_9MICC|nr:glycosyltransferase family 4 protein [Arthrobacter cheniae]RJT80913.1 glycosyltransferase [Arthrobacter cheniae]